MATYSVTFTGLNRVRNGLRTLGARLPQTVDRAVGAWANERRQELKARRYPPPPAGSKYKRTGRLANSWRAVRVSPGKWQIVNTVAGRSGPYATYVVGDIDGRQAYMHTGRWWTARDVVSERIQELREAIRDAIVADARAVGLEAH